MSENTKLGYFTGYLFLIGSGIFLFFWLFGLAKPKILFIKTIPFDSVSLKKPYPIDNIVLPANLSACQVELRINGAMSVNAYTGSYDRFNAIGIVEFADDSDKPAGEMEAEFYYDYGSGWIESKKDEKKYFSIPKSGKFNVDISLDRQKGLTTFESSTIYKDSIVNNITQKIAVIKQDTLNIPHPNASILFKITTVDDLFAENCFWGFLLMGVIGLVIIIHLKNAWVDACVWGGMIGFVAFCIWLEILLDL